MQRTPFKGAVQHYKNMAASNKQHLQGLCLVLQLRSIGVNGAELQNQTQPVDGCGAVFVKKKKQPCFSKAKSTPRSGLLLGVLLELPVVLMERIKLLFQCKTMDTVTETRQTL